MRDVNRTLSALTVFIVLSLCGFMIPQNTAAGVLGLIKQKEFNVREGGKFLLETEGGDVTVNSWEENKLKVKITGNSEAKKNFTFSFENYTDYVKVTGEKHVKSLFGWFSSVELRYEVLIPKNFDLQIATAGGDIEIETVRGTVNAKTSGGDIRINDIEGEVSLKTAGGDINCTSVRGDIIAKTSGGDIGLKDVTGKINSSTAGGDISVDYVGENKGIELYTGGGDIKISVPGNFSADINFKTIGGEIRVGLENLKNVQNSRFSFRATVGKSGNPLIAKTTGGDIILTTG